MARFKKEIDGWFVYYGKIFCAGPFKTKKEAYRWMYR